MPRPALLPRLRRAAPALAGGALGGAALAAVLPGPAGVLVGGVALGAGGWVGLGRAAGAVPGWFRRTRPDPRFTTWDKALRASLRGEGPLPKAGHDALVGYCAAAVAAYRSPGHALVLPPGLPGTSGLRTEGLEGFARSGVLLAAWIGHRGEHIRLADGATFDAASHLLAGLAAGTDPRSAEYWGPIGDRDQRMVEAGDIALIVWLLRERIARQLPPARRDAILDWLGTAAGRQVWGGNWHLFPVLASLAREAFGCRPDPERSARFAHVAAMHLGDGWFDEGHKGRVDLYSAWQMHHLLPLIARMDPALDGGLAERTLRAFAPSFAHLFTPRGPPLFGRSLPYRMAAPTPLVHAAGLTDPPLAPGLARRALDAVWRHHVAAGALAGGSVTQGIDGRTRPELVENYLGRASAFWAFRSLVALHLQPPDAPVWAEAHLPLPVETGDFDLLIEGPGLRVIGTQAARAVELRHLRNEGHPAAPLAPHAAWRRVAEALCRRPFRPDNYAAKYLRPAYRSDAPL